MQLPKSVTQMVVTFAADVSTSDSGTVSLGLLRRGLRREAKQ